MVVDFELLRPVLDSALARPDRSRGGRPPCDSGVDVQALAIKRGRSKRSDASEMPSRVEIPVPVFGYPRLTICPWAY
jgi:hypothetical protein